MTLQERRELEKQARRGHILDAAERVFFDKGFHRASMDEIAKVACLSRALLYVYFKDKDAIMRGIMLRAMRAMEQRFNAALSQASNGREQLEAIGRAYYAFSREQSDYFDVLTDLNTFPVCEDDAEQVQALRHAQSRVTQSLVQAIDNGVVDGSVNRARVNDALQTACFLQGALHGVIMQSRYAQPEDVVCEDVESLVNYCIKMLGIALS